MSSMGSVAVGIVEGAQDDMVAALENIGGADATAGDILKTTMTLSDKSNLSSMAISGVQKDLQITQQAIQASK